MIELMVNGEPETLEEPMSLAEFLEASGLNERTVVVEYNRAVVPLDRYGEIILETGDALEITPTEGGH